MKQATFNDLISLEYPDSFKELSKEENEKYFTGDLYRISFHSEEKHIILSLSKSKDSFFNRLISIVTVASSSLSNLQRNLKDYQFIEEYQSTIFGVDAITECFTYTANDKDLKQYGELSIFKYKKAFYVIYSIGWLENKEENKELFKEFKNSFKPINE